jgi:nucleoside-specific outer membrane channel protein Tsx
MFSSLERLEAASDPIGLKIAIIYDAAPDGNQLFYQRWQVKNESVLTITFMNGGDISTFGGNDIRNS